MKQQIKQILLNKVKGSPRMQERFMRFVKESRGGTTIYYDYAHTPRSRFGYGKAPHTRLYELIDRNRELYRENLEAIREFSSCLLEIPAKQPSESSQDPQWMNGWLPCLDAAALYSFLAGTNPERYIEVGSGNSTKFATRAIRDHGLKTFVLSIDPQPRAEIDAICDEVIRHPLEDLDLSIFKQLKSGDVLFIDSSHVANMNSDVAVAFLEVLPELEAGVAVHFHDIFLPYDYPPHWESYYLNEQYLLAAYLLGGGGRTDIVLANAFITQDEELSRILAPLWDGIKSRNHHVGDIEEKLDTTGGSFWMMIN